MLNAITELVAESGYQQVTIEQIAKRARVSLKTFYEHFAGKEDCFLAAFDTDVEAAAQVMGGLDDERLAWPDRVAAGLRVFLELVIAEPSRAKLCLLASQSAGSAAFARYQATLERAATVLREGRALNPLAPQMPEGLEVAIAGGIAWLVHQRLAKDEVEELRELLPEMVRLTLTPFVGEERARETGQAALSWENVTLPQVNDDRAAGM
jgi:AcrR family transcriptional regulator